VSRIDPRKGLRVLPDVVSTCVAGLRRSVDIVGPAVGAPGEAGERQIDAHAAIGVGGGFGSSAPCRSKRLLPLYRNDLFALPTLPGEGIPRCARSHGRGLPMSTRVAGIPGLITHERNGCWWSPARATVADAVAVCWRTAICVGV
jgi:hypothetical protein